MLGTLDLSCDARNEVMEFSPALAPGRLILGRLPVQIDVSGAAEEQERAAVRAAFADPRSIADRAMDHVVDRLLEELSW